MVPGDPYSTAHLKYNKLLTGEQRFFFLINLTFEVLPLSYMYINYNHRQKCWEALFISRFPPLPSAPLYTMLGFVRHKLRVAHPKLERGVGVGVFVRKCDVWRYFIGFTRKYAISK